MSRAIIKILIAVAFALAFVPGNAQIASPNYYTQGKNNRVAAEWEPAIGTMLVWPLSVPYKLVIELAKDNHLFTLVANDSAKADAIKWYKEWGIDLSRNTFITTPQDVDAWWVRDWGPSAIFRPDGPMELADGKYIYSTPVSNLACDDSLYFIYQTKDHQIVKTETEDRATISLGKGLNIPVRDLPFINTGGNVLTDGLGTAFSTCILLNENKFYRVPPDKFIALNKEMLGFERYHIISNFEIRGIQHIDCLLKIIDEERIVVAEPPADHKLYPIYESIIEKELMQLRTAYGRPYQIERIKTSRFANEELAAYTNSIIINKTIYVPLFKIAQDEKALARWRELMPGYVVKGFTYDLNEEPIVPKEVRGHYGSGYGWDAGDALHCRTRAVWDKEMLLISVKTIDGQNTKEGNTVYATIIDYSKQGVVKKQAVVYWRIAGEQTWKEITLNAASHREHYFATIPQQPSGTVIEYYISAQSSSGRQATKPATAPLGFYKIILK